MEEIDPVYVGSMKANKGTNKTQISKVTTNYSLIVMMGPETILKMGTK